MSNPKRYDCAIIGAGISGLSTAYFLKNKFQNIALIDGPKFGGVIKTIKNEGFTLECGPNVVALKPAFLELIQDLGITSELEFPQVPNYQQMVYFNEEACCVPKGPLAFLRSNLMSINDKVRIIKGIFKSKAISPGNPDLSVAEFFAPIFGVKTVKNIIDPVLLGIFGGDVDQLSAKSIFPRIYEKISSGASFFSSIKSRTARPKIAVFKNGMSSLTDRLETEALKNVSCIRTFVSKLEKSDGYFELSLENQERLSAKNVFICTSGKSTAAYLSTLDNEFSGRLKQMNFASLTVVHAYTKDLPAEFHNSFGVLFPSKLHSPLLGIMFNSRLFSHLAPAGSELLTICFGGVHHPDFIKKSDDQVWELAKREIAGNLKIAQIEFLNICRWENAIPQYNLGHANLSAAARSFEEKHPGLKFVGADFGGVGVPDRVQAAKNASLGQ